MQSLNGWGKYVANWIIWIHLIGGAILCLFIEAESGDGEISLILYLIYFATNLLAGVAYLLAIIASFVVSLAGANLMIPSILVNLVGVLVSNLCYEYLLMERFNSSGAIGSCVGIFDRRRG